MEEAMVSPMMSGALNFLALALSVVLLFAVAYLWSSNSHKTEELAKLQGEVRRMKKSLSTLEEKVRQFREPKVVADVLQVEPFGLDLSEPQTERMTPLAPQSPWMEFVEDYNKLAAACANPDARGLLKKCERFIKDEKLKILTFSSNMTFHAAIDAKDSLYWAFRCTGEEYAVVPNPMNPCDESAYEFGGMKETYTLNYVDGTYRKYFVKTPAIFTQDPLKGWTVKNPGVINLERL
ncbi:MAG: hypothetical protein SR2Q5_00590 [Quinella sp. 2Q5]|nr:hypothetical protein [Quinella sp. 2Q5]